MVSTLVPCHNAVELLSLMGKNGPITLVCAADDRYAMPLAVTVTSVAINHKSDLPLLLFVLDSGIAPENRCKIERTMQLHCVDLKWVVADQDRIRNLVTVGHLTKATFCRLLISDLLPPDIEKVLYLDSDLIILEEIEKLWNHDISPYTLLAVSDLNVPKVSSPMGLMNYQELGIPKNAKYFNAGVMLINLAKWRSENIGEKVIDYIQHNHTLIRFNDQDGLNAILFNDWQEIHPRWNRPSVLYRYQTWQDSPYCESVFHDLLQNPAIIHFTESGKPWTPGFRHVEKHYFFRYLDQTAWSGWQIRLDLWFRRVRTKLDKLRQNILTRIERG